MFTNWAKSQTKACLKDEPPWCYWNQDSNICYQRNISEENFTQERDMIQDWEGYSLKVMTDSRCLTSTIDNTCQEYCQRWCDKVQHCTRDNMVSTEVNCRNRMEQWIENTNQTCYNRSNPRCRISKTFCKSQVKENTCESTNYHNSFKANIYDTASFRESSTDTCKNQWCWIFQHRGNN